MLEEVRAVCFDLDNTLWDAEPVIARAETQLFNWLRTHYPKIPERWTQQQMHAARIALANEQSHRAHDLSYLRTEALVRHAREVGYDSAMADEAFAVFLAARNTLEPFADVERALVHLARRFRLATLTNGNADLEQIGLARRFELSLSAAHLGVAKPAPRAFAQLAAALGLEPRQILYVGDDPQLDVQGARSAGLRSAWMNRSGRAWPADLAPADLTVTDCLELAERLCA